ncbi:hypothetical protein M422DRAFT_37462 [Sphaerobolus stellatus SS14]|uniref:Uncharacterized protein n=1 Tax=Sphaerobolus stellatus (strain SS14) TaxID=990650 RepID=A0A0C9URL9_SPHS4|nr:hypothetical protein M422DRAFT_37462 [Sphaerobolus stellatus SS14]
MACATWGEDVVTHEGTRAERDKAGVIPPSQRTRLLRRLSTPVSRRILAITTQSRSWRRTRKFVNEWVLADEAKGGDERRGKGDFPFGGMVSFGIGSVGELADDGAAERFLMRTRLFTRAESLGGVESLPVLP